MKTTILLTALLSIFSIGFSKPVEKNQPTVWYYFGRNGINSCGEPDTVFPCTVEMHLIHTKEYYPYAIWYEFFKVNHILEYNVWYNFNDTTTSLIATNECNNGVKNTSLISTFYNNLGINVVLHHECSYNSHTKVIEKFNMYQTTMVDNKIQSIINIASFTNWLVIYYPPLEADKLVSQMSMQTTPQDKYAMCKFCKDRECIDCKNTNN